MGVKREMFPIVVTYILAATVLAIGPGGCQRSEQVAQLPTADTVARQSENPAERPILIMYSYAPVGTELRPMLQAVDDTVWAGREITRGDWFGPVVLANSGVGIANAAATTQFLIDRFNPRGVIFCGIAAPINPSHQIGDLMIPEHFVTYDYGYWGADGFSTDSISVGQWGSAGFKRMLEIPVDGVLYSQFGTAADNAAFRFRKVSRRLPEIHRGGIGISGNAFLDNKPRREQIYKQLKAQITDTESAAVVQTCHAAGIPVVVMRACSAPVGESLTAQSQSLLPEFFDVAAHNMALVIKQFIEEPAS